MRDLKGYLKLLNAHQRLMDTKDLVIIFNMLSSLFDVDIKDIEFDDNDAYIMSYDCNRHVIRVNYNASIMYYFNKCKNSDLDIVSLVNYHLLFALIHEFVHEVQRSRELDDDIKRLYNVCFRYVESISDNRLAEMVRRMIYNKVHDYFAIEINANVIATEYLIGILDKDYRNYFMVKLYNMIRKCYIDYDLQSMYRDELLLDTSDLNFDMSLCDKIRAGVYLDSDEREHISKKGNLRLERIVNCKQ